MMTLSFSVHDTRIAEFNVATITVRRRSYELKAYEPGCYILFYVYQLADLKSLLLAVCLCSITSAVKHAYPVFFRKSMGRMERSRSFIGVIFFRTEYILM